jgi:hypothetical protein
MKGYAKDILSFIARSTIVWKVNNYNYKIADFIRASKKNNILERAQQINSFDFKEIESLVPSREIAAGPFKGLNYPSLEAGGFTIAPKLFGTYEIEIQGFVEEICNGKYSTIINIGCAEGYYAVGFALRISDINVYAYDINEKARELCLEMATTNSVKDKIKIEEIFTMRTIHTIISKNPGFIFCDCGGAEEFIFYNDGENWLNLITNFDLLIEIHDNVHPGISKYIYNLFSESHDIQIINSVNDQLRPKIFDCPTISDKNSDIKEKLMAERRLGAVSWFYMKRKNLY